jgi:hypothetical protein
MEREGLWEENDGEELEAEIMRGPHSTHEPTSHFVIRSLR